MLIGLGSDQADDLLEEAEHVGRPSVQAPQTGEIVKALQHAVEPRDLGFEHADQLVHRPPRLRVAQPLVEQLDVDGKRGQRVLDLVVQSGGQCAQADDPLHPPDALLDQDAVAHIAQQKQAAE